MKVDIKKPPGSDGLSPYLLRECADVLAGLLTHILCLSGVSSTIPLYWKNAHVTPIPKSNTLNIDNTSGDG